MSYSYGALVEDLWQEWAGESDSPDGYIWFFAIGHVDVYHLPVYRNLARVLQLSGIPTSLQESYKMIDQAIIHETHAGNVDESDELTKCDMYGYTDLGDLVDDVFEVTIVEIPINV